MFIRLILLCPVRTLGRCMGCNPAILAFYITTITCRVGVCPITDNAKNTSIITHIWLDGVQALLMSSLVVIGIVSVVISTPVGEISSVVVESFPTEVTSTLPIALEMSTPTVIGCGLGV